MLTIDVTTTPVREVADKVWELWDKGQLIATRKSRAEIIEISHELEIKKINRIKRLEQICSRYPGVTLFKVG